MPTWIYNRVSTFEQALHGYSLDAQAKACLDYCQREGLQLGGRTNCGVPGLFVDGGTSGFKRLLADRPGGAAMLAALSPGDTVVVTSLHRMFRRLSDVVAVTEEFIDQGISLRFVDCPGLDITSANGKAVVYMLGVMAQLKSELISARIRESKRHGGKKEKTSAKRPAEHTTSPSADVLQMVSRIRSVDARFGPEGRTLAYIRVSSDEQTTEHQKNVIGQKFDVDEWFIDEDQSAYKTPLQKRSAGSRLMRDVRQGDTILILRPDRMFRSLRDMATQLDRFTKLGATIHVVESGLRTDDMYGRMLFSMLGVFAELESLEISKSTKAGLFAALAKSEAARQAVMPIMTTSRRRDRKHAQLFYLLPSEVRYRIWAHFWMVKSHYRSREEAARAVSRLWCKKLGLPSVNDRVADTSKSYANRLRAMQRTEYSLLRERALEMVESRELVHHLLNVNSLSRTCKSQEYFYEALKHTRGIKNRPTLALMAKACADPTSLPAIL